MIVTIEIDTDKYDVRVTDKKTGDVWKLEQGPKMDDGYHAGPHADQ
jgi:hypothetical protein